MHLKSIILCLSVGLLALDSPAQVTTKGISSLNGQWLVEFSSQDIGFVKTVISFKTTDSSFIAYSRKNAARGMLGAFPSMMGKLFAGLKHGSFIRIVNGKIKKGLHGYELKGIFCSPIGNYYFKGTLSNDTIKAEILDNEKIAKGELVGTQNIPRLPLCNYPALIKQALEVTKNEIYSEKLTQTPQWSKFEKKILKSASKAQDDMDIVFSFFYHARKLPFSHYALIKEHQEKQEAKNKTNEKPDISLKEISYGVAYLNIGSFEGTAEEMDSIFIRINEKNYTNLIVDLRENPGGSVEAGMRFASYIADTTFYGGIFLTRNYFKTHTSVPKVSEYQSFPNFTEANYNLLVKGIHSETGICLKVIPEQHPFKGKVFILTSNATASTCEPIVYGFKQYKRAIIIGETTAGKMLSLDQFDLQDGFLLWVPVADYYTSDGYRIDQKGVNPNVQVKSNDALNYVLKNLIPH